MIITPPLLRVYRWILRWRRGFEMTQIAASLAISIAASDSLAFS